MIVKTEKRLSLHPFMIGTLFVLICYREIAPYGKISEAAALLTAITTAVFLIHLVANRVFGSSAKGSFATTISVIFVCFAAELRSQLETLFLKIGAEQLTGTHYMAAILLVASVSVFILLFRTKSDLRKLSRFLNFATAMTVAVTFGEIIVSSKTLKIVSPETRHRPLHMPPNPPDIYYVVMDAYTSSESLHTFWGFDNSPLLTFLSSNGFRVVKNAQSNYDSTPHCLAANLGMNYPTPPQNYTRYALLNYLAETINHSEAVGRLKASGYKIINYSLFDIAAQPRFYRHPHLQPLTITGFACAKSAVGFLHDMEQLGFAQLNLQLFGRLSELSAERNAQPRFIYMHFMMPHAPYLFDQHGNSVVRGMNKNIQKKEDYLEQLIFTNTRLTNAISSILNNSERPPVIIVQGDHGYRNLDKHQNRLLESTTILNAYHLPGVDPHSVYDGITPVNSFRMVFNHYFGEQYPFLDDRQTRILRQHEHQRHSYSPGVKTLCCRLIDMEKTPD